MGLRFEEKSDHFIIEEKWTLKSKIVVFAECQLTMSYRKISIFLALLFIGRFGIRLYSRISLYLSDTKVPSTITKQNSHQPVKLLQTIFPLLQNVWETLDGISFHKSSQKSVVVSIYHLFTSHFDDQHSL